MDLNSEFSMLEVMCLARTPAGRQLLALLQQHPGDELQNAMNFAAAGDYQKASAALSSLLGTPEAQQLLKQLGGGHG